MSFRVAKVISSDAADAFRFHKAVAADNSHIWPRTEAQIQQYTDDGCLFGVWQADNDQLVALVYVVLDENTWESRGLTVDGSVQKGGIGTTLARFALAHTMAYEQPWVYRQKLIAYVHEANQDPRHLLESLGFKFVERVEIPDDNAPASMKRNAAGKLVGDKFQFTQEGLQKLSRWFNKDFNGTLRTSNTVVKFDLGPSSIEDLKKALREMVQDPKGGLWGALTGALSRLRQKIWSTT